VTFAELGASTPPSAGSQEPDQANAPDGVECGARGRGVATAPAGASSPFRRVRRRAACVTALSKRRVLRQSQARIDARHLRVSRPCEARVVPTSGTRVEFDATARQAVLIGAYVPGARRGTCPVQDVRTE
jgi:hypothetical protein